MIVEIKEDCIWTADEVRLGTYVIIQYIMIGGGRQGRQYSFFQLLTLSNQEFHQYPYRTRDGLGSIAPVHMRIRTDRFGSVVGIACHDESSVCAVL